MIGIFFKNVENQDTAIHEKVLLSLICCSYNDAIFSNDMNI